jgi:hypothetical protein
MKNYITLILLISSAISFSQNQNIERKIDSIINEEFKSKNIGNLIVVSDNLDNILIVSENKLVKIYKNKKGCSKKRVKKLNKKQKIYFRECIQNSNKLKSFKNECPERIRRCRELTYSYYLSDELQFSNSFFIDFDELSKKNEVNYLLNLYDSILD